MCKFTRRQIRSFVGIGDVGLSQLLISLVFNYDMFDMWHLHVTFLSQNKKITCVICQDKWTGALSIYTCRISIGISITKIRRSNDCLTFIMVIPIPGKTVLIMIWGSDFSPDADVRIQLGMMKKMCISDINFIVMITVMLISLSYLPLKSKWKSIHTRKYFALGKMKSLYLDSFNAFF